MSSKTSGVTKYKIKIGKANLIVVDTPGLGDTRGMVSINYVRLCRKK